MSIISSTDDVKKHVAVASSLVYEDYKPYIDDAIDQFTMQFVGDLHEILAEEATDDANAPKLNKARGYLQKAIANFAMFLYAPIGSILFDSAGMGNVDTDNRTPLSWQQVNDLKRSFLQAGHNAMDLLLAFMEKNIDLFPEWSQSEFYTESKELIVNNTSTFNKYYHIFNSRQTFLALKPSLRQTEDQYLYTYLCPELINDLKGNEVSGTMKIVKENVQKAIVAFTVAKVADEGLFKITPEGFRVRFEALSTDKVEKADAEFLSKTVEKQLLNGKQYLKKIKELILANPNDFNHCTSPLIQTDKTSDWKPYNTSGVLAL